MSQRQRAARALRVPSVVTGIGLGGFFDGIVLHQVLQWHHMLSNTGADRFGIAVYDERTVAGLRVNVLWDGLFHVTTYILVLVGLLLLWRALQRHYGGLSCPAVVMTGNADRVVEPEDQSVRLAHELTDAELRIVPGAGHMVHHAVPLEVAEAINRVASGRGRLQEVA